MLPLDCLVRIVYNAPAVPWSRVLRARSPAVLASAEVLKELVKRVLEIKDGKMDVYMSYFAKELAHFMDEGRIG